MTSMSQQQHHQSMASWHQVTTGVANGATSIGAASPGFHHHNHHNNHLHHHPQAHHNHHHNNNNQINHLQQQQQQTQDQSAYQLNMEVSGGEPTLQYGATQQGGSSQLHSGASSDPTAAVAAAAAPTSGPARHVAGVDLAVGSGQQSANSGYLSPGVCRKNSPAIKSPSLMHSPHQPVQSLQEAYQDLSVSVSGGEAYGQQSVSRLAASNYYESAGAEQVADCHQGYYMQQQQQQQQQQLHRIDSFQHHQVQPVQVGAPGGQQQCWPANLNQSPSPHIATSPAMMGHHQIHLAGGQPSGIVAAAAAAAAASVSPYHGANYTSNGYHPHHHPHHHHHQQQHQQHYNAANHQSPHVHHQHHSAMMQSHHHHQQQQQHSLPQHHHPQQLQHQRASSHQQQLPEDLYANAVHHQAHQQPQQQHLTNYGQFPAQARGSNLISSSQHNLGHIGHISKQVTAVGNLSLHAHQHHQLQSVPQNIFQQQTTSVRHYSSSLPSSTASSASSSSTSNQNKTTATSSSSSLSTSSSATTATTSTTVSEIATTATTPLNCNRLTSGSAGNSIILGSNTSPKPLQNRLGSPATSIGSGQQLCRQSSSVVSTSSVGSNLSDNHHSSSTDSPASTNGPQQSALVPLNCDQSTINSASNNRQVNLSLDDRLQLTNDAEQDSKETQLSQLHQQCAVILDEQQHLVAINSPNSNANNGTTNANNTTTSTNNNNNNNNNININSNANNSATSNGNNSTGRSKRLRTSFKHNQLKEMKRWFTKNQNPDAKDLKTLAQTTGLSKRVLQVWFQNARAKFRRNNAKVANQQLYDVNQHTSHMLQFHSQQQHHQQQQHSQQTYHHHSRPLATDQSMSSQQANQHHHLQQPSQDSPTISSGTFVPITGTQLQ